MGKHSAKRKIQKKNKFQNENKKKFNFTKLIFVIFIFIIAIFLFEFVSRKDLFDIFKSNKEQSSKTNQKITDSVPLDNILTDNSDISPFNEKNIDNTNLSLNNLFLNYENNITAITFDICNNSSENQDIFNFSFSLIDDVGNIVINYNLSSKEIIEANQKKSFVLIATRDVTNATDFIISLKK